MRLFYTKQSQKDLKSLPNDAQKRIAEKMRFYLSSDDPMEYAKKLKNRELGEYRFRVGDYRIFFDLIDGDIWVVKIRHRSKSY